MFLTNWVVFDKVCNSCNSKILIACYTNTETLHRLLPLDITLQNAYQHHSINNKCHFPMLRHLALQFNCNSTISVQFAGNHITFLSLDSSSILHTRRTRWYSVKNCLHWKYPATWPTHFSLISSFFLAFFFPFLMLFPSFSLFLNTVSPFFYPFFPFFPLFSPFFDQKKKLAFGQNPDRSKTLKKIPDRWPKQYKVFYCIFAIP